MYLWGMYFLQLTLPSLSRCQVCGWQDGCAGQWCDEFLTGSLRFLLIQAPWLRPVVTTARTLSPRLEMPVLWVWGFVDFVCVVCELDDLGGSWRGEWSASALVLSLCIESLSSSPHTLPPC